MFEFGTSAIYFDSVGKTTACRIFIDIGSSETYRQYYAQATEIITVISVLLTDVPTPRQDDQIRINEITYQVESAQAQDDLIALLHVKKL